MQVTETDGLVRTKILSTAKELNRGSIVITHHIKVMGEAGQTQ